MNVVWNLVENWFQTRMAKRLSKWFEVWDLAAKCSQNKATTKTSSRGSCLRGRLPRRMLRQKPMEDAVAHINRYGSKHTDAIVTESERAADQFALEVDTASVMINASTRFNDGGEFGLGAEIGISTDKFHARGPCGLKELTSYKYIVQGSGQIRG